MKRLLVGTLIPLALALGLSGRVVSTLLLTPAYAAASSSDAICGQVADVSLAECNALVALFQSTGGAHWVDHANWLTTHEVCSWSGVVCNEGHVVELYLPSNGLSGVLPAELGALTSVEFLDFSDNALRGDIPATLTALGQLEEIYLADTKLVGVVDDAFGTLTHLSLLDVRNTTICMEPMVRAAAWLENLQQDESMAIQPCANEVQLTEKVFLPFVVGQ